MVFFLPENMIFFFFGQKMKDNLSQDMLGNIFSVYMYECCEYDITLLPKKIKDDLLRRKYT